MAFSFASIPLPVLIGVPVVGIVAAVIIFEVEKNRKAAAAAAALQGVAAKAPAGATGPVTANSVAAAAPPTPKNVMGISKGGQTTWMTPAGPVTQASNLPAPAAAWQMTPAAWVSAMASIAKATPSAAATTGFGPQIVTAAQQAYAAIGAQPSQSDITDSLNWQIVAAALYQLQSSPTPSQLSATLTTLQSNGSSYATTAYPILQRVYATVST
jgi:hypothetical protein